MKLNNYIKYSLYPRKKSRNFIKSIIITNLLFFLIFLFKGSLNHEITKATQHFYDNTAYEELDLKNKDEVFSNAKIKSDIFASSGLSNTYEYSIRPYVKINNVSEYVYISTGYDFLYHYGYNPKIIAEKETSSNYTCTITINRAIRLFKTEDCLGKVITVKDKEYEVNRIICPNKTSYGIYSKSEKYINDYLYLVVNDYQELKNYDDTRIEVSYHFSKLDSSDLSLLNKHLGDYYANVKDKEQYMYGCQYIFNILDSLSMFAIFFFIINTVVLLLSKIELTKNDVKIRNIFYSNYKNNLIGYSIGFGFIYSISIICSLIIISIIHIILAINFGNFNWINGKVIAFIIIEIVSSIAVSIIMTLNRKNDTLL